MHLHVILALLVLVGFGAGFVQRVSGFGLGIFAMIFLPYFMPTATAAATVSCLFSCGTSSYNSIKYRKNISYKTTLPMLISSLITIPIAVFFASKISGDIFTRLLGAILVLLSLFFLFLSHKIKMKTNVRNGIIAGSTSGVLSGLFSTGGPPAVIYLSSALSDKLVYFATIQFFFAVTNVYATATRAINGLLTLTLLGYALVGFLGCMIGDFVGKLVFDKLDGEKLKGVIYVGMILSGVVMML